MRRSARDRKHIFGAVLATVICCALYLHAPTRLAAYKLTFSSPTSAAAGCDAASAAREYAATEAVWGRGDFLIDTDGKADMTSYGGEPGGYLKSLALALGGPPSSHKLSVLNVGANKGQFAKHVFSLFPLARVDSFEAFPGTFALLEAVHASVPAAQKAAWSLHNLVVSDEDGVAQVFGSAGDETSHTGEAKGAYFSHSAKWDTVSVPATTLATWLKQQGARARDIGLLHIDAEGHDLAILAGLRWREHRIPLVVFETSLMYLLRENNPKAYTLAATLDEAAAIGYECFFLGFRDIYRISPRFAPPGSFVHSELHSAARFMRTNAGANVLCILADSSYYAALLSAHKSVLLHCQERSLV